MNTCYLSFYLVTCLEELKKKCIQISQSEQQI